MNWITRVRISPEKNDFFHHQLTLSVPILFNAHIINGNKYVLISFRLISAQKSPQRINNLLRDGGGGRVWGDEEGFVWSEKERRWRKICMNWADWKARFILKWKMIEEKNEWNNSVNGISIYEIFHWEKSPYDGGLLNLESEGILSLMPSSITYNRFII